MISAIYGWAPKAGESVTSMASISRCFNEGDGLLSNYIHSLYSKNDSLLVGSEKGLSIRYKSRFINFEMPAVRGIHPTGDHIYLATQKGLYLLSEKNGDFSEDAFPEIVNLHPEIDTSAINTILWKGERYWIATNEGLWSGKNIGKNGNQPTKLESNWFSSIALHEGKIFAATLDDGIRVISVNAPENSIVVPEPHRINALSVQNGNELWVATENEGIVLLDTETLEETGRLDANNGLGVPHVRNVFADRRSHLWIATSGGGVLQVFAEQFYALRYGERTQGQPYLRRSSYPRRNLCFELRKRTEQNRLRRNTRDRDRQRIFGSQDQNDCQRYRWKYLGRLRWQRNLVQGDPNDRQSGLYH